MTGPSLAERAGAGGPERRAAVAEVLQRCRAEGVHSVRLSFADQHGLLRGKTVATGELAGMFDRGCGVPGSLLAKDTGQQYAVPLWVPSASPTMNVLLGARDMVLLPDPATFRVLPWAGGTGWLLCDLFTVDGEPVELSTRGLLRRLHDRLEAAGYGFVAGLEFELHVFRPGPAGPEPVHAGWDLLGEQTADVAAPVLELLRDGLDRLGLAPRTLEVELGPGQLELTFPAGPGPEVADRAVLVRSAVKQLAARNGLSATFMCRPKVGDSFPSGWHLHQSLVRPDGTNAFVVEPGDGASAGPLSAVGERWVAGLLEHAAASCLLTTPTVTGYKRYRPNSVAPDRIAWSRQHRGALLRVIGGVGDPATHVENRVGDPAANPYLYLAAQLASGLDGLERDLPIPPEAASPYEPAAGPQLPRTLGEAIVAFRESPLYRSAFGDELTGYLVTLATSAWNRYLAAVSDWEQREYFEQF